MIATFALLTQAASSLPSDASALEKSISALESCISALDSRAEILASSSASLEPWSWLFTGIVALGVAMEFWVIWDEHRENMETWALAWAFALNRTARPSTRRLIFEYVSVLLIAGGIIGELVIGIEIASINTQLRVVDVRLRTENSELRSKSDQLLALVTNEAGNAATSAKNAHDEADAVGKEADALSIHIREEAAQLNAVTPRSVILRNSERTIAKALSPFPGQYFGVERCGSPPPIDDNDELEKSKTTDALFDAIKAGQWMPLYARWSLRWNKCPSFWKGEPAWRGIFVFVDKDASPKILEAANVLSSALKSVLPPQPTAILVPCDLHGWLNPADQLSPCKQIFNRPYAIGVLIGAMPLASEAEKKASSKISANP